MLTSSRSGPLLAVTGSVFIVLGVVLLCGGPEGWLSASVVSGALGAALVGSVVLAVYIGILALFRTPELAPALALGRRFLPKR